MEAGMYPQAISLLEKRVNEKPTDAEAHYELGVCYINTGNFRGADQRFASAVKLKPDYGFEIGGEYQKAGNDVLNNGNSRQANRLYIQAVKYQPNLKQKIAQYCFNKGASELNKGCFDIAIGFDSEYKMKSYKLIMDKADTAKDEKCVAIYQMG